MLAHETDDAVFYVGRVTSVEGRRVTVAVDKEKNSAHLIYRGGIVRNVSVGSYVKLVKGFSELIAQVDGEYVHEDRSTRGDYRRASDKLARSLKLSLVGFIDGSEFVQGIRELPLLDNECFILQEAEFNAIHRFGRAGAPAVTIGVLATDPTQRVAIGIDELFGSHIGIFGNTGSGKSYTLAKLYRELFATARGWPGFAGRSQFVLIDFNGEYADREGDGSAGTSVITSEDLKANYRLSTRTKDGGDRLPLPESVVTDYTFWTVLLDATERTQSPFLKRVLASEYWDKLLPNPGALQAEIAKLLLRATVQTDASLNRYVPMQFLEEIRMSLGDVSGVDGIDESIQRLQTHLKWHSKNAKFYWEQPGAATVYPEDTTWPGLLQPLVTDLEIDFSSVDPIDFVRFKIILQYYRDVINGFASAEHLGPLIKRMAARLPSVKKLIRVSTDAFAAKPLTIVSLRDVNLEMRKVIPMLLCKHLYDLKKETDTANDRHMNLIIDEAHNILSTQSSRESDAWRDYRLETFEEIIKEGRKFGVFLTIASQRPHDISETIISQLHNYFLHRLVNNLDIHAVERAVSYLDKVSFEALPILATGSCVFAGVSAQIPVVVKIDELPDLAAPNSTTISVVDAWRRPLEGGQDDHAHSPNSDIALL